MSNLSGDFLPLKIAFSQYLKQWHDFLYGDTPSVREFIERGFPHGCQWVPGRMVDEAESMLAAYRKNDNAPKGRNTKLPVVLVGMSKEYTPMGADWGGRQLSRKMVRIEDGGSVYGYRQAMYEKRVQVVIFASEEASANSLAAQFSLFVGDVANRRFTCEHQFGQYTVQMPVILESPDILFMEVKTDQQNITILAADLTLKAQIPYFDAPRPGEPNDGTANQPPGYPLVEYVNLDDQGALIDGVVHRDGVTWE